MTDQFHYRTKWGANLLEDGRARFSLWAPALDTLALVARDGPLPMARQDGGWFDLVTDCVAPGDAYAFRLPDGMTVPDPVARAQAGDVHGPSQLVDPGGYPWRTGGWRGRPWEEAVVYELHTGTFTEDGTFAGVERRLDHLAATGVTVIEVMPVAQFGGNRGWGYDGVLMYAPHRAYGGPNGLKALVDTAHARGLMIILDVVYNHFGPDGNYLHLYAPDFFDPARETPWGGAIAYDRAPVRDFFVDNALYWLEEYRFDGLRFDAINEIHDPSPEHLLETIAKAVRARINDRHIHLTTEDDRNITRLHERAGDGCVSMFTAEWNDDFHHAAHVAATSETEGYYVDYAQHPVAHLARALSEGFAYQGEVSQFWGDAPRGVPSRHQPPTAFVNFIQNHDQVGNRAFNERLTALAPAAAVEALTAVLLLGPHIPMLFMGEEWGEVRPFGFFTDFHGRLADAVREGRRREFRRFTQFANEANRAKIPDPNALSTYESSRLDWSRLEREEGQARYDLVRRLLDIRRQAIVPRLGAMKSYAGAMATVDGAALGVRWTLGDGAILTLIANLGDGPAPAPIDPAGTALYESAPGLGVSLLSAPMPDWSVLVCLEERA